MRILALIFVLALSIGVSAQSYSVRRPFTEGTRLAKAGEFEKALASYLAASNAANKEHLDGNFLAKLHYNIGVCEYRLDRPEQAIKELERAVSLTNGAYPRAFYALGMAESARENWPVARLAFLKAVQFNKTNGEAWFDLAFAYLGEKDLANAEAAFRNAIAYKSIDTPLGHNNLGVLLALKNDLSAAEKEFEAALRSSGGKLPEAKSNLEYCRTHASTQLSIIGELAYALRNSPAF